jgi:chromate transport protein ChrA
MLVLTIVVEYADNLMRGSTIPYFQTLTVSERSIGPSMLSLSIPIHDIPSHTYNSFVTANLHNHSPVIIILIIHNLLRMLDRVKYNLATTNNPSLFHFYLLALLLLQIVIFIIISLNPISVI